MECWHCGKGPVIESDGEYVCRACGTVVGTVYYARQPPVATGGDMDLTPLWKSVERRVRAEAYRQISFYAKLRVLNRKLRLQSRPLYKVYSCVRAVASMLGIDERTCSIAIEVLDRLSRRKPEDVTYYQLAAAALIYVIVMHNLPISTRQVIEAFRALGHRVAFGDLNRAISLFGGLRYSTRDRVRSYMAAALPKIFSDNWVEVYRASESILNSLGRSIQGKNPALLAAAIIYCAALNLGRDVKLEHVARALSVSQFTLRDYVKKVVRCY